MSAGPEPDLVSGEVGQAAETILGVRDTLVCTEAYISGMMGAGGLT